MTTMTIEQLIERSHVAAVNRGRWNDDGPPVADQVNDFHAAISRAWEELDTNAMIG